MQLICRFVGIDLWFVNCEARRLCGDSDCIERRKSGWRRLESGIHGRGCDIGLIYKHISPTWEQWAGICIFNSEK